MLGLDSKPKQFVFRADAKPFVPDELPLSLKAEIHDLSTLVDNFVADVEDFKFSCSKTIQDPNASTAPTVARDFMGQLLESLSELCAYTPREAAAAMEFLNVPYNTPAASCKHDYS